MNALLGPAWANLRRQAANPMRGMMMSYSPNPFMRFMQPQMNQQINRSPPSYWSPQMQPQQPQGFTGWQDSTNMNSAMGGMQANPFNTMYRNTPTSYGLSGRFGYGGR